MCAVERKVSMHVGIVVGGRGAFRVVSVHGWGLYGLGSWA